MKIVAIIQARLGSTRLPGKVLKKVYGKSILQHVVTRVKAVKSIDEIVIATTKNLEDKLIENEANKLGIKCYCGSETNVLQRYYEAAKQSQADVIIRITSDCPLIDPLVISNMVSEFENQSPNIDYLSNTLQRTFPRGLDVEIFTRNALERCYNYAKEDFELEHVTPYIYNNPNIFRIFNYKNDRDYSMYRITIDTEKDFRLYFEIYDNLYDGSNMFYLNDIISFLESNPEIAFSNHDIKTMQFNNQEFKGVTIND